MEFSKDKYITLTLHFLDYGTHRIRNVYKFDEAGIYYTHEYRSVTWCGYNSVTKVLYAGEEINLTYEEFAKAFPRWINEKYGDEDYVELNDILI